MAQNVENDILKKTHLQINLKMDNREFTDDIDFYTYRVWDLTRRALNLFMIMRFASINLDVKLNSPADIQEFAFGTETICQIGESLLLQSWEEAEEFKRICGLEK